MNRKDNWKENLAKYFAKCEARKFKWGEHDCVLAAAGAADVVYGTTIRKELKGLYTGKTGALKAINDMGNGSLWVAAHKYLQKLGFEHAPVGFVGAGDIIGAYNQDGREMMGIMEDYGTATFVGPDGLARLPSNVVAMRWV